MTLPFTLRWCQTTVNGLFLGTEGGFPYTGKSLEEVATLGTPKNPGKFDPHVFMISFYYDPKYPTTLWSENN